MWILLICLLVILTPICLAYWCGRISVAQELGHLWRCNTYPVAWAVLPVMKAASPTDFRWIKRGGSCSRQKKRGSYKGDGGKLHSGNLAGNAASRNREVTSEWCGLSELLVNYGIVELRLLESSERGYIPNGGRVNCIYVNCSKVGKVNELGVAESMIDLLRKRLPGCPIVQPFFHAIRRVDQDAVSRHSQHKDLCTPLRGHWLYTNLKLYCE